MTIQLQEKYFLLYGLKLYKEAVGHFVLFCCKERAQNC